MNADVTPERVWAGASRGVLGALGIGLRSMRRYPLLGVGLLAATIAQGLFQGLLVWALRHVLVQFSVGHTRSAAALAVGGGTILAIWLLRASASFTGEVVSARLAHRVEIDWMYRVLGRLLGMSVRFFERNSQGDLVMASYVDLKGFRGVTLDLATVALALARLAGLAAVAWVLSPRLAVVGLVAVPLGALPAFWFGQRITAAARFERDSSTTLYDSFLQVSTGIRAIKTNRGEARVLERARAVGHDLYGHVVRQAQSRSLARLLMEVVSGFGLIAVLVLGGRDVGAGRLEWQSLMSLLIAIMAVYAPVLSLLQVYGSVRGVIPNLDRIHAILEAPAEVPDAPDARRLLDAPETIVLEDVAFAYDQRIVLDGVSACFRRGETIGVVGPSGTGKSTLIALMLRLYDPTRGRVLYDGVDARSLRHADLMDRCAIVLQEPFLFVDTVANNIRTSRPDAPMEDVIAAARAANVHDEIMAMERGYDTIVGRRRDGRGVSVGQRQRICIAGAVLKNAPVLFLDEATSSLDSASERAVQGALDRLMRGRTTFVIAHRLSTLRSADRILVLDGGRVVGLAPHDSLLDSCPTYRRLWRHQTGGRASERRPAAVAPGGPALPPPPHPRIPEAIG